MTDYATLAIWLTIVPKLCTYSKYKHNKIMNLKRELCRINQLSLSLNTGRYIACSERRLFP